MIPARNHPRLASVTIRRLVLAEGQRSPALGEAIAAALSRELAGAGPAAGAEPAVAQAIARDIANHPVLATAGAAATAPTRPKP